MSNKKVNSKDSVMHDVIFSSGGRTVRPALVAGYSGIITSFTPDSPTCHLTHNRIRVKYISINFH